VPILASAGVGFPFYVKKLITPQIVTDVTDGHYVGITVVTVSLPRGWIQGIKRMYPVLIMHGLFLI
jgi:predicted HAD superfamily phosphohydrolase YqeG